MFRDIFIRVGTLAQVCLKITILAECVGERAEQGREGERVIN